MLLKSFLLFLLGEGKREEGERRRPVANTCEDGDNVDLYSNRGNLAVGRLNEYNLMSFIKATPHSFN